MSTKLRWHLDHLDSLRGIAVLGVLLVHAAMYDHGNGILPLPSTVLFIAFSGQRGVALFFIVSAFTLFLSLDNRKTEEQSPTRNFFIRRLFRIAPMFYVAMLVDFLIFPQMTGPWWHMGLAALFLNGFTLPTIAHGAIGGWSVANEALFYACVPILYARIRSLTSALIWVAGSWVALSILGINLSLRYPSLEGFFAFASFSINFTIFLMGIAGYFLWKEMLQNATLSLTAKKQISLLMLALAAILYWSLLPFTNKTLYPSSVVCLLLLLGLSVYPWPFLVNKATRFLGKISFSIYLLHFVVILTLQDWLQKIGPSYPVLHHHTLVFFIGLSGTLLVTIPLAYVSWRWIEEPGIRLGRRLIAHLEGRTLRANERALIPPPEAAFAKGNSPDSQF